MAGVNRLRLIPNGHQHRLNMNHLEERSIKSDYQKPQYQYEHGGMLVYDSNAKMYTSGEPMLPLKPVYVQQALPKEIRQQIDKANVNDKNTYYRSSCSFSVPDYTPTATLQIPEDKVTLRFDSKFESGNLSRAVKLSDYEYHLFIRSDTNTSNNNHWYYFSVYNPRNTCITFKICNMLKFDILYKSGMKPCVYSTNSPGWHRDGTNIVYQKEERAFATRTYYSLKFDYRFQEGDLVYFAYSVPYTYSDLESYLENIRLNHSSIARVSTLCKSLGDVPCEMVTITKEIETYMTEEEEAHLWGISASGRKILRTRQKKSSSVHSHKKAIVVTARVHSGETVGSYMMKGVMDFLLEDTAEARALRENFIVKLVPMLNADGVQHGNYRTSLLGVDLNRRWKRPNKILHPTIYYTKKMIEVLHEVHEVLLYCDLHGHTRKRNVFMYGCDFKSDDFLQRRKNLLAKVFPVVFPLKNKLFSFFDSHFRVDKDKRTTARVVLFKEFAIAHCYTMEASFFGPSNRQPFPENYHMSTLDLESIGRDLCSLSLMFYNPSLYLRRIQFTNDFLRQLVFKRAEKLKMKESSRKDISENPQEHEEPSVEDFDIFENFENLEDIQDLEPVGENIEIEDTWNDIEIVDYSDNEGSVGSNSSVSDTEPPSKMFKRKKIDKTLVTNKEEPPMSRKSQLLPESQKFVLKNISAAGKFRKSSRVYRSIETSRIRMPISTRNIYYSEAPNSSLNGESVSCEKSDHSVRDESQRRNRWGSMRKQTYFVRSNVFKPTTDLKLTNQKN